MASLPRPSSTFDVGRPLPLEGSTPPSSTMEAPKDSIAIAVGVSEQLGWDSSPSNHLPDPGSGPNATLSGSDKNQSGPFERPMNVGVEWDPCLSPKPSGSGDQSEPVYTRSQRRVAAEFGGAKKT